MSSTSHRWREPPRHRHDSCPLAVTFNVCLGRDFEGCGLVFCGMIGAADHRCHRHTYHHKVGACVVHLGARRHGADHITSGERLNLVVWNHGLAWRESDGAMAPRWPTKKKAALRTRAACRTRTIETTAPSSPTPRASSTSSIGAGAPRKAPNTPGSAWTSRTPARRRGGGVVW